MNNCEIVDNVACGRSFQYCRTHKVEPHNCPGNKKPEGLDSSMTLRERLNQAFATPAPQKREFKVGDRVRIIDPGVHEHLRGTECQIERIFDHYPDAPYVTSARSGTAKVAFGAENLELV